MTDKRTSKAVAVKPPTPAQRARRSELLKRNKARPERPESTISREDGRFLIEPAAGRDEKAYAVAKLEALGTRSIPFLNETLDKVMRVMSPTYEISEARYNAAIAIMAAVEPQNELEATLASQMVAANECAMRCMINMAGATIADQHKMFGDQANKFMRTFAAQLDVLSRLRRGGEQVVRHVYVGEGGQAVFAKTINQGGGGNLENDAQTYGTREFAERSALPCPDATGN